MKIIKSKIRINEENVFFSEATPRFAYVGMSITIMFYIKCRTLVNKTSAADLIIVV